MSDEEVYTLNLIWHFEPKASFPNLTLWLVATDADQGLLQRAERGCYPASSLKELPATWREQAFVQIGDKYCLREKFRTGLEFRCQDIRSQQPQEAVHLVLCRYMAFTYYEQSLQQQVLTQITERVRPGGGPVIGKTEFLPDVRTNLIPWVRQQGIYRRIE